MSQPDADWPADQAAWRAWQAQGKGQREARVNQTDTIERLRELAKKAECRGMGQRHFPGEKLFEEAKLLRDVADQLAQVQAALAFLHEIAVQR